MTNFSSVPVGWHARSSIRRLMFYPKVLRLCLELIGLHTCLITVLASFGKRSNNGIFVVDERYGSMPTDPHGAHQVPEVDSWSCAGDNSCAPLILWISSVHQAFYAVPSNAAALPGHCVSG